MDQGLGVRCAWLGCFSFLLHVVVANDLAAFHDEFHVFELLDIAERVSVDGDQVSVFAGFKGPDIVGPAEKVGGIDGG